jgi:hypothetical protein
MSDSPAPGAPGQPPVVDPVYAAQAAQAVEQVQGGDQSTDAGASIEEIVAARVRAALSGFEQDLAAHMKAAEDAFASNQSVIDSLTRQLATVRAQAGPPVGTLLANSLAQRVQAIASANPDLPAGHFAGVISQAQSLAEATQAVANGNGNPDEVERLANGIGAWFSRVHPRASGKVLEGMHAALDEAERIIEEIPKLAPAAAAIAGAV